MVTAQWPNHALQGTAPGATAFCLGNQAALYSHCLLDHGAAAKGYASWEKSWRASRREHGAVAGWSDLPVCLAESGTRAVSPHPASTSPSMRVCTGQFDEVEQTGAHRRGKSTRHRGMPVRGCPFSALATLATDSDTRRAPCNSVMSQC